MKRFYKSGPFKGVAIAASFAGVAYAGGTTIKQEVPTAVTRPAKLPDTMPEPKQKPTFPGLGYVAQELQSMNLGWDSAGTAIPGGAISGYEELPNGEQVEVAIFTRGNVSVGTTRLKPSQVGEILLNVYASGVNHLTYPDNTLYSYWFTDYGSPSPHMNIGNAYEAAVSSEQQQKLGVVATEAFQDDTVSTYALSKHPATEPYLSLIRQYGDGPSANRTIISIEDQALMIASHAAHDTNLPVVHEIQPPSQFTK